MSKHSFAPSPATILFAHSIIVVGATLFVLYIAGLLRTQPCSQCTPCGQGAGTQPAATLPKPSPPSSLPGGDIPSTPDDDAMDPTGDRIAGQARLIVFGANGCGACQALKAHLKQQGHAPYVTFIDVSSPAGRQILETKVPQTIRAMFNPQQGVPQLVAVDAMGRVLKNMVGFSPDGANALMGMVRT